MSNWPEIKYFDSFSFKSLNKIDIFLQKLLIFAETTFSIKKHFDRKSPGSSNNYILSLQVSFSLWRATMFLNV